MNAFLKNFMLFVVDFGCLLLPLAWYNYPLIIVPASLILIVCGFTVASYYHNRDIHVNEYVFKAGQPVFVIVYAWVLWKLSLPLITVPIGVVLFVVIIVAIQLFRKYILGICDSCRCDIDKK